MENGCMKLELLQRSDVNWAHSWDFKQGGLGSGMEVLVVPECAENFRRRMEILLLLGNDYYFGSTEYEK